MDLLRNGSRTNRGSSPTIEFLGSELKMVIHIVKPQFLNVPERGNGRIEDERDKEEERENADDTQRAEDERGVVLEVLQLGPRVVRLGLHLVVVQPVGVLLGGVAAVVGGRVRGRGGPLRGAGRGGGRGGAGGRGRGG